MFCQRCGGKLKPTDQFCPTCGAKNEQAQTAAGYGIPNPGAAPGFSPEQSGAGFTAVPTGEKKSFLGMSTKGTIIAIVCAVVTIVLAVVLLGSLFGHGNPKSIVKSYYSAVEDCDAKEILELVPKQYVKYVLDEGDMSKKELTENIQEYLDNYYSDYDDIKVSVSKQEKLDKEDFAEYLDFEDDDKLEIKKAYQFDLKVRYTSDDEKSTEEEQFIVVEYKGHWYSVDAMFLIAMAVYMG